MFISEVNKCRKIIEVAGRVKVIFKGGTEEVPESVMPFCCLSSFTPFLKKEM